MGRSEYRLTGRTIVFIHTETDPAHSDRALASTLVERALDDVRARGLRVIARRPSMKAWIAQHHGVRRPAGRVSTPEYADLLVGSGP